MTKYNNDLKALALSLFEINAFKFGDFKMKSGVSSPVYFDLRVIVSYPDVMKSLSNLIIEFIKEKKIEYDHICGVPYTALPIASIVSVDSFKPMLIRRKEAKSYGTKKMIEGKFNNGDICLIIEDIVTTGSSVLETVRDLASEGIKVTDAIIVVDREQGGYANIRNNSVRMHSLFTLSNLLKILKEACKINAETVVDVAKYIEGCQLQSDGTFINKNENLVNKFNRTTMTFEARAKLAKSAVAKDLFDLMADKKTNLCLAMDLTKTEDILNIADKCGPYICLLKTHIDIVEDFNENFLRNLKDIAKRHNFLLMEDRKFADIGNTVALQYSKGIYRISEWADLVTAHSISGPGILKGLKSALCEDTKKRGVFLLAEMSSEGTLTNDKYKEATVKLATDSLYNDFVTGVVCQSADCFSSPGLIQLTPGVKIDDCHDDLGQNYFTPEHVVKEKGADIGVVGRGILNAQSVDKAVAKYRDRLWAAYMERVS